MLFGEDDGELSFLIPNHLRDPDGIFISAIHVHGAFSLCSSISHHQIYCIEYSPFFGEVSNTK